MHASWKHHSTHPMNTADECVWTTILAQGHLRPLDIIEFHLHIISSEGAKIKLRDTAACQLCEYSTVNGVPTTECMCIQGWQ